MTNEAIKELEELFIRTEEAVTIFMNMLQPKVEGANDEYQHLYWHHIYEEEEQRLDRLKDLLPRVNHYVNNKEDQSINNLEFIHLLQDISLEKFGLHNFEEHLDLALYDDSTGEHSETLRSMRKMTEADYERIKVLLNTLNEAYGGAANRAGSVPTDEKENVGDHLKLNKFTNEHTIMNEKPIIPGKKKLTVGSLKYN
ncbi:IMEF encapsulin system ferritin-like cargo protein [Schinkia azotoformans]|uniref:IMEF encapsulin system ferritin-like cargo protein n=1 Tax=Schinkia azotoformans TaxID=1454 RepID=UPI002DC03B8A|nr:IMEF encapsulin system ferritin-like cargo protein [Schinkia azotoformans]MEC1715639.1 hypothetical protein [Schinkia azotoformans]MEC1742181.1 hypothetical protein [Schinkia azotoformans]MEC1744885.1 hypothetical protein [Schinkia azotoformans]MEC1757873.1 hypothetical protein [Schinkia azotoformans]MEC1766812.1 hypothetical protein [Schinkia azotoformans]